MKFELTFITLLCFQLSFEQNNKSEIKYGLYGIYADPSFYQELTILKNGTFLFYDRLELGSSNKYEGKWKTEENQIVLYDFKNSERKPIPTKFISNGDQLCTDTKDKICLKWQEPKSNQNKASKFHNDNIRIVFENYIKQQESTDLPDNKYLMTNSLKSLTVVTDKDDLELLINVQMYYDPTDYLDIPEIYRILKSNRPQSIEAVKNRIDNIKEWETDDTSPYSDLKNLLKRLENE